MSRLTLEECSCGVIVNDSLFIRNRCKTECLDKQYNDYKDSNRFIKISDNISLSKPTKKYDNQLSKFYGNYSLTLSFLPNNTLSLGLYTEKYCKEDCIGNNEYMYCIDKSKRCIKRQIEEEEKTTLNNLIRVCNQLKPTTVDSSNSIYSKSDINEIIVGGPLYCIPIVVDINSDFKIEYKTIFTKTIIYDDDFKFKSEHSSDKVEYNIVISPYHKIAIDILIHLNKKEIEEKITAYVMKNFDLIEHESIRFSLSALISENKKLKEKLNEKSKEESKKDSDEKLRENLKEEWKKISKQWSKTNPNI